MKSFFATAFLFGAIFSNVPAMAANDTKAALETLKSKLNRYGAPKTEGTEETAGKKVAALYFGKKKINNNFDIVDDVKKTHGGTATLFVKEGNEFVRVSTNVLKDDGTRAIGTELAHNKAYETVVKGDTFCGEVEILKSPYDTCYEPIKDATGKILGIYYFGYKK
ncbi:MAG: Cache 3/Cache 2 fusion domain-containing protein [Bacteriovorax sp.]